MEERKNSLGSARRIYRSRSAEDALKGVDLNRNIEALVENPLVHLTPEQLQRDVLDFARTSRLEDHLDLLRKGAQIAKDPQYFDAIPTVTDYEKEALRDERSRRFRQPLALYLTIIICSIGAAVQGWDQTGSNGANLNWPQDFGLDTSKSSNDVWILGLVNAAPYIAAAFIGCWLSHPLNHHLGRRGTIFFAAWFCFFSVLGSACTQTWVQLFICRLLLGLGMGAKASTIPVLAAENSPASIRGSLVMGWQLWVAFGIFLGLTANLILYQVGPIAWRLQLGSAFIPAIPLVIGIYFCPESPRWYIKKHRYHDAFNSLQRLRNTPLQAARDLYYIHAQVRLEEMMLGDGDITISDGEEHYSSSGRYTARFVQLFTIARIRRATLAAFVVMIAQQMCGINILAFYSSTLFVDAKASEKSALLVSWGFGLINFAFAWPAVRSIDYFGRRKLLLFTFPHMAWTLLASGFCFYIPDDSPAHLGMITLFIYLFAAMYSPGEGPVPFTYSAEAFPLFHREVGMSLAVSINLFWAAVLTIVFPKLTNALTPTGAIGFFAGLNVIAFWMIFLWVPETKQRTLEELDYIFAVPTTKHMDYQMRQVLPYTFQRSLNDRMKMQSPSDSHGLEVASLCASIRTIIANYVRLHQTSEESDIDLLRHEVQKLHKYLELIEKVRSAGTRRLELEQIHLQDVDRLLNRCHRALSSLEQYLIHGSDQDESRDLRGLTFAVPRVHISFYTRTLEMSLMSINLSHRWKGHVPHESTSSDWKKLSKATRALRESVLQRRGFLGGDDQEDSVEERGLLRDVEHCVRSAEEIMRATTTEVNGDAEVSQSSLQHLSDAQSNPWINGNSSWTTQLPLRNGSSVAPSQSDSRTEEHPSDGSEVESLVDPEPDLGSGFTPEIYSSMFTNLWRELQRNIDAREYNLAEKTYRTLVKHHIDRENNLGIQFDNRIELSEKLVEIYLNQEKYQKAKQTLGQLLQETSLDADRKCGLYLFLAKVYCGQQRPDKALPFAQRSLSGREELYGRSHGLTYETAVQVIDIYEQKGEETTANALRGMYCSSTLPPPPPKSALRATSRRRTPSPPQTPLAHPAVQNQAPPGYQEEVSRHYTNHVRWAPDVWVNDSGINATVESGRTLLIDAIYKGDEEYVKLLLKRGANVETPCVDTISPLMHAVTQGFPNVVEILLDHDAQVDTPTSGWTPLHRATDLGNTTMMRLLLDRHADVEFESPLDFIPPKSARARLKANSFEELYREEDAASDQVWTPLLRAAVKGDKAAVSLLLEYEADIEAQSPDKKTPLLCACESLAFDTVDLLLLRGANVRAHDGFGWRPLHRALVNIRSSESVHPILPRLLDHEAEVNARCNYRKTPLHYAIEKNNAPTVTFLLSNDADIEARDIAELTPLHTAILHRLASMVQLLLEQGADVTAMDQHGQDALAAATHANYKSPEIIALLQKQKKRLKRENSAAATGQGVKKPSFGERKRGNLGGPAAIGTNHAASGSAEKVEKGGWFRGRSGKNKSR